MRNALLLFLLIPLFSCSGGGEREGSKNSNQNTVQYAEFFDILESDYAYFVTTRDRNKKVLNQIVVTRGEEVSRQGDKVKVFQHGARSTACLSSVFVGFLSAVNRSSSIVAVDELDYISDPLVRRLANAGRVSEVGGLDKLNFEVLAYQKPDILFASEFDQDHSVRHLLSRLGIYTVFCNSFREKTPLARAEWIKLFGVLTGEYEKAKNVFAAVERNYNSLRDSVANIQKKPTAFMNALWGDQWSIPGGNSFQAILLKDAGAKYIWSHETDHEIIFTGFETMLINAGQADFWLNVNTFRSMEELYKADSRYENFKAFEKGNVYNNNANENDYGGIPYWETGAVRPDWVLSDLVEIFHPDIQDLDSMKYYHRLK